MKFSYKPSPNYRSTQTTSDIMKDLTICLCAVLAFSAVYHGVAYGISYGIRVLLMAAVSVGVGVGTEAAYYTIRKYDVRKEIRHSYSWVTALILVLISRLDVSYFALIIATIIAIVFGKLVFGGFGQNIFNPAAFGEAIIMNSFAASKAAAVTADVYTGATPMAAMNSYGWLLKSADMPAFLEQFGGFGKMFLGLYPSVIGGSCALVIILCGAYMLYKKDIDWHLSVTYLLTVFVISLIVGLVKGAGISYALFNILGGGVLFGAVFMMTDPVTTPITIPGRMIFAVGCASLTLILRWKSNLPDGVLFSILLMNMVTPAIDKLVDGNQIKNERLIRNKVLISSAIILLVCFGVGATLEGKQPASSGSSANTPSGETLDALRTEDLSANKASCTESSNDGSTAVYACEAFGFEGTNKADITVDLSNASVKSVVITEFNDTVGIGDAATSDDALAVYNGITLDTNVDASSAASPATSTKKAIRAMIQKALAMANGEEIAEAAKTPISEEKLKGYHASCEVVSDDGSTVVFACKADGFVVANGDANEATITVDAASKSVTAIEITKFGDDGDGIGDDANTPENLERYIGATLDSGIDNLTGASKTSGSIKAMVRAALESLDAEEETALTLGAEEFSLKQSCEETSNDGTTAVYACKANGFAGANEANVTVDLSSMTIKAMEVTNFADDGDGVGDNLADEDKLAMYVGAGLDSSIDAVSGATKTSNALRAMAATALKTAAGE